MKPRMNSIEYRIFNLLIEGYEGLTEEEREEMGITLESITSSRNTLEKLYKKSREIQELTKKERT